MHVPKTAIFAVEFDDFAVGNFWFFAPYYLWKIYAVQLQVYQVGKLAFTRSYETVSNSLLATKIKGSCMR